MSWEKATTSVSRSDAAFQAGRFAGCLRSGEAPRACRRAGELCPEYIHDLDARLLRHADAASSDLSRDPLSVSAVASIPGARRLGNLEEKRNRNVVRISKAS